MFNKKEYMKEYYLKNKRKILNQQKKYYEKNKLKVRQLCDRWKLKHKQRYEKWSQFYIKTHKKEHQRYNKEYYKKNKSKLNSQHKIWAKNNKKKIQKQRKKYTDYKRKTDINFKILENLRNRIYHALKDNCKSKSTMQLIGCSIEYLKQHIQKQFKKGMNWNNWGRGKQKWNIDHIKPCRAFNLSKTSEQKKCFNYSNLQPLWVFKHKQKTCKERKR